MTRDHEVVGSHPAGLFISFYFFPFCPLKVPREGGSLSVMEKAEPKNGYIVVLPGVKQAQIKHNTGKKVTPRRALELIFSVQNSLR